MLTEGDGAEPGVQPDSPQSTNITQEPLDENAEGSTDWRLPGAARSVHSGEPVEAPSDWVPISPAKREKTLTRILAMLPEVQADWDEPWEDHEPGAVGDQGRGHHTRSPASAAMRPEPESVFSPEAGWGRTAYVIRRQGGET